MIPLGQGLPGYARGDCRACAHHGREAPRRASVHHQARDAHALVPRPLTPLGRKPERAKAASPKPETLDLRTVLPITCQRDVGRGQAGVGPSGRRHDWNRTRAIGLRRRSASIPIVGRAVYVDSGSVDGSVDSARSRGFEVVELDTSAPMSAGRARNAGIDLLTGAGDDSWGARPSVVIQFVLVIDGDCELFPGFIEAALEMMRRDPPSRWCGRRRAQSGSLELQPTV